MLDILLPAYTAEAITNNIRIVLINAELIERRCREVEAAGVPRDATTLEFMCRARYKFVEYLTQKGKKNESPMNNNDKEDKLS